MRNRYNWLPVTLWLFATSFAHADIVDTSASVRPDNALIVDIQITTTNNAAKVAVTYQTAGVDPLVSQFTPVSKTGLTTVTVGRLRAEKTYTYVVRAIDEHGAPAGIARGSFTTGSLPAALLKNTYTLKGRTTVPLVIMPQTEPNFAGYVAFDLHSADAPQIVWYYTNPPSTASGKERTDPPTSLVRGRNGNFIGGDAGSDPAPLSADVFYREFTPDGTILSQGPVDCSLTPSQSSPTPKGWVWAQGNDTHEVLAPAADGVERTVLHLGKIVKDPFFEAGVAPQGARLQSGTAIRRWNLATGKDQIVWDPFAFLNPLTDRTDSTTSDPGANSNTRSPIVCSGSSLQIEEWMHANSLQVAPTGEILMGIRHLDTVIAISPQFDGVSWRIGRLGSDFAFPNPSDRFYHQHFVRMLENGNLLLFDNGNGRPASEGGQYSRALELALDWDSMTAEKVWEYRHQLAGDGGSAIYKYSDKVGTAQRLGNGNTIVLFGSDIDPKTLAAKAPQTFTLVEADASPEGAAVATLDIQIPGANSIYRALPVQTLFGEVPGKR